MFFSIIMQSTLREYTGCAQDRPDKLKRAISSVIDQTFTDWELIVVADNCQESEKIADAFLDNRITSFLSVEKHNGWSTHCRNLGLEMAEGKYILYLDNDDYFSVDYLQELHDLIIGASEQWFIVDHYEFINNDWKMVRARVGMNSAGTANVIHASSMHSRWPDDGRYGSEDWTFIRRLMNEQKEYQHLAIAGYYIAHKRGIYDR